MHSYIFSLYSSTSSLSHFLLIPTLTHSYSHLLSLYPPHTCWDRESRENEDVLALDSLNAGPVGGSQVRRGTLRQKDMYWAWEKGREQGRWREGRFFHQSMQVRCTAVVLPAVHCIADSTEHTYITHDSLSHKSHTQSLSQEETDMVFRDGQWVER